MKEDLFFFDIKALIHNKDDNILLLKKHSHSWDLPGGRVSKNEHVEDTLKREVFEETGLEDITSDNDIGTFLSNIRISLTASDAGNSNP